MRKQRGFGPIGIYFRQKNAKESEYVYLRTKRDDSKRDDDDIQYAPVVNGVLLFNMMSPYDGPAPVHNKEWNHVKACSIRPATARVYVNDMSEPVLEIPRLESNSTVRRNWFRRTGLLRKPGNQAKRRQKTFHRLQA